jgi:hypothetical protein
MITAIHDVIHGAGVFDAQLPSHAVKVVPGKGEVNLILQFVTDMTISLTDKH